MNQAINIKQYLKYSQNLINLLNLPAADVRMCYIRGNETAHFITRHADVSTACPWGIDVNTFLSTVTNQLNL